MYESKYQITPVDSDEIDLRDIIMPLWKNKWRIFLWGSLFTLIIAIHQLGGVALSNNDQAQIQVHFNFAGASTGTYPNGTQFSPQQLLSQPVLHEVYSRYIDTDMDYENFTKALTLTPNFVGAGQLEEVVTHLIDQDKGLSITEFNDAVETYTVSLRGHSKTNVTLSLDLSLVDGNMALATRILTAIVDTWAEQAIKDRGVMKLYKPHINSQIISSSDTELLIRINVLSDTQQRLAEAVAGYSSDPQLIFLTDPKSGLTLADLSLLLSTEGKYKIAILKEMIIQSGGDINNFQWHDKYREARLSMLARERNHLQRMVTVYTKAMTQLNQQQEGPQTQTPSSPHQPQASQQVYSPQYSDDLVNSLLQLGSKMSDPEYRKALLDKKLKYSAKLQETITEIVFYQSTTIDDNRTILDSDKINQLIDSSINRLTEINDVLSSITGLANIRFLSDTSQLYSLQGAVQHVANNSLSGPLKLKLLLAFMLGCFIGVVLVFFKLVMAPTATPTPLAE